MIHFSYLLEFETLNEGSEVCEDQNIAPEISSSQNGENDHSKDNGDDEQPVGNTARYKKRKPTYQRKVNSIDSALDESNYEAMIIPEKVKKKSKVALKINRTKRKQLCITITLIVENTNRKINNLLTSVSEEKLQTNTFMKVTTLEEVQAFVGLLLYRGLDSAKNLT